MQKFTEIVGQVLQKNQADTYFDTIARELEREHKIDYLLGIAVKSNKVGFETDEKIEYIHRHYVNGLKNDQSVFNLQGTFAGWCIKYKEEVKVGNLDDLLEREKYGVSERDKSFGGEAKSLVCVPLIDRKKGNCFGALTMQFRETGFKNLDENLLKVLSDIFSYIIDPDKYLLPPIDFFLDQVVESGDRDYHDAFENNRYYVDAASPRIKGYQEVDNLLKWNSEETDNKFSLLITNGASYYYHEYHPFNHMLKGLSGKGQNIFTNGMVLFLGIVAYEHLRREKPDMREIENPFFAQWNEIVALWMKAKNKDQKIEFFFKGFHDDFLDDEENSESLKCQLKKNRMRLVYDLFYSLIIKDVRDGNSRGNEPKDDAAFELNTLNIDYNYESQIISFSFEINNIEKLEDNIRFNRKQAERLNAFSVIEDFEKLKNELSHGLSSKIVRLDMILNHVPLKKRNFEFELTPASPISIDEKKGIIKLKFSLK